MGSSPILVAALVALALLAPAEAQKKKGCKRVCPNGKKLNPDDCTCAFPEQAAVGFRAEMSDDVQVKSLAVFDAVKYNEGGAYDGSTGVFTAPVSGQYFFYFSTEYNEDNPQGGMAIKVDGETVGYTAGRLLGGGGQFGTANTQAVVSLDKGQQVYVQTQWGDADVRVAGGFRSSFGGFLVN